MGTLQTKYEWFLVSDFIEDLKIILQILYKITNNSMTNRGSNLIIINLVGVHPRNIHTKFEANLCSDLREVKKFKTTIIPMIADTGWSQESLIECD